MERLVNKTRQYLENNYKKLTLPFMNRFPQGSCESAALVLGKVLSEEFSDQQVTFVKGTNTSKHEMHFWVEVDDLAFDITADQFESSASHSFGQLQDAIAERFNSTEKLPVDKALTANEIATSHTDELERISNEIRKNT